MFDRQIDYVNFTVDSRLVLPMENEIGKLSDIASHTQTGIASSLLMTKKQQNQALMSFLSGNGCSVDITECDGVI